MRLICHISKSLIVLLYQWQSSGHEITTTKKPQNIWEGVKEGDISLRLIDKLPTCSANPTD